MHLLKPAAAPAPPTVPPASPSPFHRQLVLIMRGMCLCSSCDVSCMLEQANLEVHLTIPSKATTSTAPSIPVHPVVFATPGKRV